VRYAPFNVCALLRSMQIKLDGIYPCFLIAIPKDNENVINAVSSQISDLEEIQFKLAQFRTDEEVKQVKMRFGIS